MEQYSKEQLDYRQHVMKVYKPDCTVYYDMVTGCQMITHMQCKPEPSDYQGDVCEGILMVLGEEYNHWIAYENYLRIYTFLKMDMPYRSIN